MGARPVLRVIRNCECGTRIRAFSDSAVRVTFPDGAVVFVCAATANRDPSVFANPQRFDITVDRGGTSILTFGNGPHFCVGATLARVELAETYSFLAPRMLEPQFRSPPVYGSPIGIYAMEAVPIRFEQGK